MDEHSKTNGLDEILITIWFTQIANSNTVHVKSLILTDMVWLYMRVLLPSLQYALEIKRENSFLQFHIECATI